MITGPHDSREQGLSVLSELRSLGSCNSSKSDDVGDRVPTQAVRSMHSACRFAGSIESDNALAIDSFDLGVSVDAYATHGVVNSRGDFNGIIGRLVKSTRQIGSLELARLCLRFDTGYTLPGFFPAPVRRLQAFEPIRQRSVLQRQSADEYSPRFS